jgi:amino acid transporter
MGPQGTLPAALARLNPRYRVPWNAMHVVFAASLIGVIVVTVALKNAATRLIGFEASEPVGGFDAHGRPVRQPEI